MKVFKKLENEKFLHGKTQNRGGVNALIWKRSPKDIYVGLTMILLTSVFFYDVSIFFSVD